MFCLCYAQREAAETVDWLREVTACRSLLRRVVGGLLGGLLGSAGPAGVCVIDDEARDCYLTLGAYRG